mmetsp:Transcript_56179/g.93621  ORF Transcript_56179/g.93621 Transcript_56179/m.93621 type:complete len:136 (+) Transcript_56179:29-436(+)
MPRTEERWQDFDVDTDYLRDPSKKHIMKVSEEECNKMGIASQCRDLCTHILIPLNQCRKATWYMPWRCSELYEGYTKCLENDAMRLRAVVSQRFYQQFGIEEVREGHTHATSQYQMMSNPKSSIWNTDTAPTSNN